MHKQYVKNHQGTWWKSHMETMWPTKSRIFSGGNCQDNDVGYKCDATRSLPKKSILDLRRENGRAVSIILFKHKRYSNKATLSSYMWLLKSVSSETLNLKWSVLRWVPPCSNTSKKWKKDKLQNSYLETVANIY